MNINMNANMNMNMNMNMHIRIRMNMNINSLNSLSVRVLYNFSNNLASGLRGAKSTVHPLVGHVCYETPVILRLLTFLTRGPQ